MPKKVGVGHFLGTVGLQETNIFFVGLIDGPYQVLLQVGVKHRRENLLNPEHFQSVTQKQGFSAYKIVFIKFKKQVNGMSWKPNLFLKLIENLTELI